jgi:hypothetical protein
MNKGLKIGLGLAFTGIAFGAYQMFSASQKLVFGNAKKTGQTFKPSYVSIYLTLPVTNPTNTTLPFDSFRGKWSYNGRDIADVTVENWVTENGVSVLKSIPIEAGKTVNFPIEIRINYFKAVGEIMDMINSSNFLGASLLKGTVKSGGLNFNITTKIF